MSKYIFNAKLLQVETSVDQKTGLPKIRLVFASQRYDKGYDQILPVSQNVTLIDGHHHLVPTFEALKGKEIYLPIEMSTMMNGMQIFYKTVHDGRPLNLVDNKNEKSIP